MLHRLREVIPGLYRGSAPSLNDLLWLKNSLHINKIISLDQESGDKIGRAIKLLGMKHVKLYINEDYASLASALHHNLKKLLLEDGPTYIHCKHGKDRTGLIIALFQCQYLGVTPEDALHEAKSLGFGVGVDHKTVSLFEKLIKQCKPRQDNNAADIVSNEREYVGDNRDTYLDKGRQQSWAPYLDHTRQAPYDAVYNYIVEQSPTRQNFSHDEPIKEHDNEVEMPQVGIYNNDGPVGGFGPVYPSGGFISD
jgi:hypothetical protein